MAIRNIVARRKDLTTVFIEAGVEDLLQTAMKRTQRAPTVEIKAALRDLGCQVQLHEEWTGKGASMTNWNKKKMREKTKRTSNKKWLQMKKRDP